MKTTVLLSLCILSSLQLFSQTYVRLENYPTLNFLNEKNEDSKLIDSIVYYKSSNSQTDSKTGRQNLIKEAFDKALSLSVSCYPGVLTGYVFELNPRTYNTASGQSVISNGPGQFTIRTQKSPISFTADNKIKVSSTESLKGWEKSFCMSNTYSEAFTSNKSKVIMSICVEYADVQRKKNTYSEIIIDHSDRKFPNDGCFNFHDEKYLCIDDGNNSCGCANFPNNGWRYEYVRKGQVLQFVSVKIIIYPLAFNSNYFYMPTERSTTYKENGVNTQYGPWSKKIEHTLLFLILHEFAHLDYFIAKTFPFHFDTVSYSNDEKDCDSYASSILKCVQ